MTHFSGSPFLKFESPKALVNSFARQVGSVASYSALPPSP